MKEKSSQVLRCCILVIACVCLLPGFTKGAANCTANGNAVIELTAVNAVNISTPSLGAGTYPNMSCAWNITAPPGHILVITVPQVSWTYFNNSCSVEYIRFYDGDSSAGNVLGTACFGKWRIDGMLSSGPNVFVEIKTGNNPNRTSIYIHVIPRVAIDCSEANMFNLTASLSGTANFTSPYYPYGYLPNSTCSWRISAPAGHVVKLSIKPQLACIDKADWLEIYDGDSATDEYYVNKYCYNLSPVEFYSTGELVFLRFISGALPQSSSVFKGFIVDYTAFVPGGACLSSNTAEQNLNLRIYGPSTGVITSPNYPSPFQNNMDCIWRLHAPVGHVVKLYFDSFDINVKNCFAEPLVRIYDGYLKESPSLRTLPCVRSHGKAPSFFIISSGRKAKIQFKTGSNSPIFSSGFTTNYTFETLDTSGTCKEGQSGIINLRGQGSSFFTPGYLQSSGSTGLHPKNMTCVWNITVDPGYRIKIKILDNKLTHACNIENATFHDGPTASSAVLFNLCKDSHPNVQYTTGNNVFIELKTSTMDARGGGFLVSYMAVRQVPYQHACTSVHNYILITKSTGNLASYDYPGSYPNFASCTWRIRTPFSNHVKLTITSFDLQSSQNCSEDFLRVKGGRYYSTPLLATLCGRLQTPHIISSSGEKMSLTFESGRSGRYPGFEAHFESVPDPSFGNCRVQGQDNLIPLSGSRGVFFSPRYPYYYPRNMMCTWIITVPEGRKIKLRLKPLTLDSRCKSNLEVRDGNSNSSKLIGRYCGWREPPSVFSSGKQLWVRFTSSKDFDGGTKFYATFEAVNTLPLSISCRQSNTAVTKVTSASGAIASYEFPLKYDNDVTCVWSIVVSSGKRVKLTFESFDLESSAGCKADYVEVRDGYSFSEVKGRFCGSSKPQPVYSSDDRMYIKFVTNGTGRYGGFKASFESISELSLRTIILIVVFTIMAVLVILSVIGWCFKAKLAGMCRNPQAVAAPEGASVAGSTIALTTKM